MGLGTGIAGTATGADPDWSAGESRTDPHTRATLRALVDAVIPETPGLADRRGDEHEAGGVTIGLDDYLVPYLNDLLALGAPALGGGPDARLAEAIAAALDESALELLARNRAQDTPDPAPPGERGFDGDVTAWEQTGYPGPANGYAALRGYLRLDGNTDGVDLTRSQGSFEENDYATDDYTDPYPEPETTDVACRPDALATGTGRPGRARAGGRPRSRPRRSCSSRGPTARAGTC